MLRLVIRSSDYAYRLFYSQVIAESTGYRYNLPTFWYMWQIDMVQKI